MVGKHKKHRRNIEKSTINNDNIINSTNSNGNNNLMELLNNIDQEQISSLLSSLNLGNINSAENNDSNSDTNRNDNDKTLQILNAIKPMVNAERGELIDRLIQLYTISRIINK